MNEQFLVLCRTEKILYNAYNLVKAFFPDADVKSEVSAACPIPISVQAVPENAAFRPVAAEDARSLYCALRKITGRDLPWGMLTGVRPVKLASAWIERNPADPGQYEKACEDFIKWFSEERFVSTDKARLAFDIAMREKLVCAEAADPSHSSIYVSIPFCPSVCRYCSFSQGPIGKYAGRVNAYLDALEREMRNRAGGSEKRKWPDTIYIGGGTPTSLDESGLERLLLSIDDIFHVREGLENGKIREYTIEAGRPDSITRDKLELIRKYGATRISINPQTMQQRTLDLVGRAHTPQQTEDAYYLAREMGFHNINMDLIMGLPSETNEDVRDTLEKIKRLAPDSLTVHCLALKRSSSMGISARTDRQEEAKTGDIAQMISDAYDTALEMGLFPYYLYRQKNISGNFENIGYAKPGKEGLYNIVMMEEVQSIEAFGAGATSKKVLPDAEENPGRHGQMALILRSSNPKSVDEYIKRQQKNM